jgi:1,4-alpha-glucan branching enzyme
VSKRDASLQALAEARHDNPFGVLGPHVEGNGVVIRACIPTAERIAVTRDGSAPVAMKKRHPAGIFEAVMPGVTDIPDYRLRVTYGGGATVDVDDPYRYGPVLSDYDLYLFGEGTHTRIYDKLGAHLVTIGAAEGVHFAVWAPNARRVSVVADFNAWDGRRHPMRKIALGVWEIFIPGVGVGEKYKFELLTAHGEVLLKSDPFGFAFELPPLNASIVVRPEYEWRDAAWMASRAGQSSWFEKPFAVYEVHLGSWARVPEQEDRYLSYSELAARLIPYVKEMG